MKTAGMSNISMKSQVHRYNNNYHNYTQITTAIRSHTLIIIKYELNHNYDTFKV